MRLSLLKKIFDLLNLGEIAVNQNFRRKFVLGFKRNLVLDLEGYVCVDDVVLSGFDDLKEALPTSILFELY